MAAAAGLVVAVELAGISVARAVLAPLGKATMAVTVSAQEMPALKQLAAAAVLGPQAQMDQTPRQSTATVALAQHHQSAARQSPTLAVAAARRGQAARQVQQGLAAVVQAACLHLVVRGLPTAKL